MMTPHEIDDALRKLRSEQDRQGSRLRCLESIVDQVRQELSESMPTEPPEPGSCGDDPPSTGESTRFDLDEAPDEQSCRDDVAESTPVQPCASIDRITAFTARAAMVARINVLERSKDKAKADILAFDAETIDLRRQLA